MKSLEDVRPGDTLGRYELLAPVAQGGMAAVWAARFRGSRGFQRVVAIKTILPTLVDNPMFEEMFLDEASLASQVRHPHVAQILDLGEENEVLYLVMEWVDGESLSVLSRATNRLTGKPVPIPIAGRIIMQAAAGLHAAHELRNENGELVGLVHRDVSPQNILLTYNGSVKIVDFGVAKAEGLRAAETMAGQLKGKLSYMSPEQALGHDVDRRTDIFALGTIFYQLITGKHPFRGESDLETLANITERPVLRPRLVNPEIPEAIDIVLMKALAKEAHERYPTMSDFESALGKAMAKLGMIVNDTIVKEFLDQLFSERAKKRRDALQEAMVAADEQLSGWRDGKFTLSPSHSGLTPPPGYRPSGDLESSRRTTPPSLAAVASDRPAPLRDVPTVADRSAKKKGRTGILLSVAGALAVVTIGAFAMLGGERGETNAGVEGGTNAALAAPTKAAESSSTEEDLDAEEAPAEVVPAPSAAIELDWQGHEELVDEVEFLEAIEEGEDLGRKPTGLSKAPAKATPPRAPAGEQPRAEEPARPAPKRRRVPEVQDPGF